MSIEEQESERRFAWRRLVWKFDKSPTREVIDNLADMATQLAVDAERLDIDSTPMVVAINALRRARSRSGHTEDLRASLDAVEVVLGRFLYRRISKLPPSEAVDEVKILTTAQKRKQQRQAKLIEYWDDPEWRLKTRDAQALDLRMGKVVVSAKCVRDDLKELGLWEGD
jgi:hypothetical protein